nr:mRNA decapping enzyme 2 [Hymenolepis microstoma]
MHVEPKPISEDILKLLYALFISNCPHLTKSDWNSGYIRIFTELELAHWHYLDNYVNDMTEFGVDMFGMCKAMFENFPKLVPNGVDWVQMYKLWKASRVSAHTAGAAILDEDFEMVLLVQGFNTKSWTFPSGKVAEKESLRDCAVREVMEEVGLDIEHRIVENLFMDVFVGDTRHRVYIVEGFPKIRNLQPSTKNEIEVITWFSLSQLNMDITSSNSKRSEFLLIAPFILSLQQYVNYRKSGLPPIQALKCSWKPKTRRQNQSNQPLPSNASAFSPYVNQNQPYRAQSTDRTGPKSSKRRTQSQAVQSRPNQPGQNRAQQRSILKVDPSKNSSSIFGGQVSINVDTLINIIKNHA